MDNMIDPKLKIVKKPMVTRDNDFPYESVLNSLKLLDKEKCVTFTNEECVIKNVTYLQSLAKKHEMGKIRTHKKDGLVYMWMEKK